MQLINDYLDSSQPLNSIDLLDLCTSRKIICKFLFGTSDTMRLCFITKTIITKFILFLELHKQGLMSTKGVGGYESKPCQHWEKDMSCICPLVLKFDPGICHQY